MAPFRMTQEGISLRFGEPDTPVPEGVVSASPPPRIVVAVGPPEAQTRVSVVVRSGGRERTITLRAGPRTRQEQFFEGDFPDLRGGDQLQYSVRVDWQRGDAALRLDSSEAPDGVRVVEVTEASPSRPEVVGEPTVGQSNFPGSTGRAPKRPAGRSGVLERGERVPLRGDDIRLLQQELRQLGFDLGDGDGVLDSATSQAVLAFQEANQMEASGILDESTANRINLAFEALPPESRGFVVRGCVRGPDGSPLVACTVRAFEKGLRYEMRLGEDNTTDKQGHYTIAYTAARLRQARMNPDLIVRVFDPENQQEIAASAVRFGAKPVETIDLVAGGGEYRGASEYEQLMETLAPALQETPIHELSQEDVSFLADATGVDRQCITFMVESARLATQTGLPSEVFYGLARQNLPIGPEALLGQSPSLLRQCLETALADNVIPTRPNLAVDEVSARLREIAIDEAVTRDDSLGGLLRTSALLADDANRQQKFAKAFLNHEGTLATFWDSLRDDPDFADARVVGELNTTLDLGVLTRNHLPMVRLLKGELRRDGALQDLRTLAAWSTAEWREAVRRTGVPPETAGRDEEEKTSNYAEALFRDIEARFPTAVVVNRLRRENGRIPGAEVLLDAFDRNNEFELATADIGGDIEGRSDAQAQEALRSWKRVFRLSPTHGRYEVMKALKASELDSAEGIVRLGRSAFVERYANKLDTETLGEVWNKAGNIHAMTLTTLVDVLQMNAPMPRAIPSKPIAELPADYQGKATLEALFGSLDFCECEHCKSVYSPAAYFVDLLRFLSGTKNVDGRSLLAVLLGRRPDLSEIELSCENTNTRLPYVDLVNEVLENAVVRFALAEYGVPNLEDLAHMPHPYPVENHMFRLLRDKFTRAGYPLTENAKLSSLERNYRWLVTDDGDKKYVILREEGPQGQLLYVYPLSDNQTGSKEDELSARPEHINQDAYFKLARAFHPWNLPFDPWWDEAHIYLKHLGLARYEWMEKLPQTPALSPLEVRVACDHLGLTTTEYELITGAVNRPEPELWGLDGGVEVLCGVKRLLRQASFDSKVPGENFRTLEQTVHSHFLDPENVLAIRFEGDPGELEKATLAYQGAGQPDWPGFFGRMRRFLRLQRKLGWTIPDLDKAITTFVERQPTDLDPTLIQRLSNLECLRAELNVPRPEMLSWWGIIDTAEDRSEEEAAKKSPSLYEQVFLNKSVDNPVNALFKLNEQRNELEVAEQQRPTAISEVAEAVAGALGISVTDLRLLLERNDGTEEGLVGDELNLENLSALHRIVSLSKALRLKVREFLSARSIIGIDPFADSLNAQGQVVRDRTTNAREFVKQVREIQASAFTVPELDYLLRHRYEEATDLFVPTDAEIARVLAEVNSGLARIAAEAAASPDPQGELMAKRLALLVEAPVVEQILQFLKWKASTVALPQGVNSPQLSPVLEGKVTYDQTAHQLRLNGPLTQAEKTALLSVSPDPSYQTEISKLYDEPRSFFAQELAKKLNAFPWLGDALQQALDHESGQEERFGHVLEAVNESLCRTLSENLVKERLAGELTLDADIAALLLEKIIKTPGDMTKPVLAEFLALAAPRLSEEEPGNAAAVRSSRGLLQAERSGAYAFRVLPDGNTKLWVNGRAIEFGENIDLEAGKFYSLRLDSPDGSQPEVHWQPPSAPDQPIPAGRLVPASAIASYRVLHKSALLLGKLKTRADELSYLAAHGSDFKQFDLNRFSRSPSKDAPLYEQWRHLNKVFAFRDAYSQTKVRVIDVFAAAQRSSDMAKEQLLAVTDWNRADFDKLAGPNGFALGEEDLKSGGNFDKLRDAFTTLKRLGASAEQLLNWVSVDLGVASESAQHPAHLAKEAVVQSLKQVVQAKYDRTQWLTVAQPLRDELREKQRSALVAYLVHDLGLHDANELYERYLIDVQMSPCMMTSRIVQAVSTVQLFVQRSLMGLEPEASLSPEMAAEWEWRKNYRVWEANRKVFLYPENWIEPELRDGKSPFFEDLENELLQNEVTDESVGKAFLQYLHKLDEVSRLEIVGMCEQADGWFEPTDNSTQAYVLHVFGRTYTTPHIYYYRRWVSGSYWTPWERIDVDIEGDHLIPFVWRRRLYLFWPLFTEKSVETEEISQAQTVRPSRTYWDIQLAWSEYQNGKWTAKTVGPDSLSVNYEPAIYELKPQTEYYLEAFHDGELRIKVWCNYYAEKEWWLQGTFTIPDSGGHPDPQFHSSSEEIPLLPGTRSEYMYFVGLQGVRFHVPYVIQDVLGKTPSNFKVLFPRRFGGLPIGPFFYQDREETFLAHVLAYIPDPLALQVTGLPWRPLIKFSMSCHAYSNRFLSRLNQYGLKGLLDPAPDTDAYADRRQMMHEDFFVNEYSPNGLVVLPPYPCKEIDFSDDGAYSQYNWEIFFHAPLLIADRLSKNQRFAEAVKWFHYIFNPTEMAGGGPPERFWMVRPFYEVYQKENGVPKRIQELMVLLNQGDAAMERQVAEWRRNPFKPHVIARLRTPAYMKSVVMKYIDNLIAWGDQLFRQFTMESINEATQLYILAAEILGPRPEQVPAPKRPNWTYRELEEKYKNFDDFSNVLVKIESGLPASGGAGDFLPQAPPEIPALPGASGLGSTSIRGQEQALTLDTLFFCIPHNEVLVNYWDTVEDRLFKIRHCMTIEGTVRELPLFQPPIDPGLLVRAVAAGIDIASVLTDLSAPLPRYRFQVMAQKATELCTEVRSIGAALLSAIEKKDAEELALIRSRHEVQLLEAMKDAKKKQIEEATAAYQGLLKAKELAQQRQNHYARLINEGFSASEKSYLESIELASIMQMVGQMLEMAASSAFSSPDLITGSAGWAGTPVMLVKGGGSNVGSALGFQARNLAMMASAISTSGTMASVVGGFQRREQEWRLQEELAKKEVEQIDKQIAAAEIRVAISEVELRNHESQTANSKEIYAYMRGKFTNSQLYGWMVSQLSSLYFGSYQLAYDLAKRAEMAYRHELGLSDSDFIKFGYWDSLKKGLLAGERLHFDLKRMETAYLEGNKREYEITKHCSLALLDPASLFDLQQTGSCYVSLPEALFDLDYPGHYMRRIKSIGVTIPCVTGPFTGVNCTLTLVKSSVRHSTLPGSKYTRDFDSEDTRFTDGFGVIQSIVTSSAQNDTGLFETNLHDERYLPFEGTGAISTWRIELPREFRQFDYSTISDFVLHMRYTARDGGDALRDGASRNLRQLLKEKDGQPQARLFSLSNEFPSEWQRLQSAETANGDHSQAFSLAKHRFPFVFQGGNITINKVELFGVPKSLEKNVPTPELALSLTDPKGQVVNLQQAAGVGFSVRKSADVAVEVKNLGASKQEADWTLKVANGDLQVCLERLKDILFLCYYSVDIPGNP